MTETIKFYLALCLLRNSFPSSVIVAARLGAINNIPFYPKLPHQRRNLAREEAAQATHFTFQALFKVIAPNGDGRSHVRICCELQITQQGQKTG